MLVPCAGPAIGTKSSTSACTDGQYLIAHAAIRIGHNAVVVTFVVQQQLPVPGVLLVALREGAVHQQHRLVVGMRLQVRRRTRQRGIERGAVDRERRIQRRRLRERVLTGHGGDDQHDDHDDTAHPT